MRFLIVDDSKSMQTMVYKAIVKAGYQDHEFSYALNGVEALDLVSSWNPDIVLSDWHMPEMNGLELLQKINEKGVKVKVGLITTERSKERVKAAKQAGALFVVSKPFNAGTLQQALDSVLEDTEQPSESSVRNRLILPSSTKIIKAMSCFNDTKVDISICTESELDYSAQPYLVALYEDASTHYTVAAIIMDAAAAANIGASMQGLDINEVEVCIQSKSIPQRIYDNCKKLLNLISTMYQLHDGDIDVDVKTAHLVTNPQDKLKKLIKDNIADGYCLQLAVENYGVGKLILLKL